MATFIFSCCRCLAFSSRRLAMAASSALRFFSVLIFSSKGFWSSFCRFWKKEHPSWWWHHFFLWQNICRNSRADPIILSTHYKLTPFPGTLKMAILYYRNVKDFDCVWCNSIDLHILSDYCWCRDCRLNIARRAKVINGSTIRTKRNNKCASTSIQNLAWQTNQIIFLSSTELNCQNNHEVLLPCIFYFLTETWV